MSKLNDNIVSDGDVSKKRKMESNRDQAIDPKKKPKTHGGYEATVKSTKKLEKNTRNFGEIAKGGRNLNDMIKKHQILNISP